MPPVPSGLPDDMRLLLVKEAVRQAELRLTAQAHARQVLEVRGTAVTQFLVTLTTALTAGRFTLSALRKAGELPETFSFDASIRAVTTMTGFSTVALIVSITSLVIAGPGRAERPWQLAGDNPRWVFTDFPSSEERALLSLVKRYALDIERNQRVLSRIWIMTWIAVAIFVSGIGCSYLLVWWATLSEAAAAGK